VFTFTGGPGLMAIRPGWIGRWLSWLIVVGYGQSVMIDKAPAGRVFAIDATQAYWPIRFSWIGPRCPRGNRRIVSRG